MLNMIHDEGSITVLPETYGRVHLGTFAQYLERKFIWTRPKSFLDYFYKREVPWSYTVDKAEAFNYFHKPEI